MRRKFEPARVTVPANDAEALRELFDLVAPVANWKHPVNHVLPVATLKARGVTEDDVAWAVGFFTGETATIEPAVRDGRAVVIFRAPGYYRAVGA